MNKTIQGVAIVIYPQSCPIDNIIEHIMPYYPIAISPLHCRDLDKNGKLKKPHYHILFQCRLLEKDKRLISKITTINYFENVYDFKEYYNYLVHWSSKTNWFIPGKAQYWTADIMLSERWNSDYKYLVNVDIADNCDYIINITSLIKRYGLTEFQQLVDLCASSNSELDYLEFVFKHTNFFVAYINSKRYSNKTTCIKDKRNDENYVDSTLCCTRPGGIIDSDLYSYRISQGQKVVEDLNNINFPIDFDE